MKNVEEFFSLIKTRRSVRKFSCKAPDLELVLTALEAAIWAPNAHNAQPWRFIVLEDKSIRLKLAEAMAEAWRRDMLRDGVPEHVIEETIEEETFRRFLEPPYLIIACLDKSVLHRYPDERRCFAEYIMGVQSLAAAIENLLLALHALGLGACWYCAPLFCQKEVRRILNIPEHVEPQAIIAVGYPAESPRPPPRKPLSEVVFLNKWGCK